MLFREIEDASVSNVRLVPITNASFVEKRSPTSIAIETSRPLRRHSIRRDGQTSRIAKMIAGITTAQTYGLRVVFQAGGMISQRGCRSQKAPNAANSALTNREAENPA